MTGQLNISCGPTGCLSALKIPGAPASSLVKEGPRSHLGFVGGDGILSTESKYFKNDQLLVKPCEFLVPFFIPLFLDEVSGLPQARLVAPPHTELVIKCPIPTPNAFYCNSVFFHLFPLLGTAVGAP